MALRPLLRTAGQVVGLSLGENAVDKVADFLTERFRDQSQNLPIALQRATDRAWRCLEVALAGETLWTRLRDRREDQAFRDQVGTFLAAVPLVNLADDFRRRCHRDLQAARKAGLLVTAPPEPGDLARQTALFARFADPQALLQAEWQAIDHLAQDLNRTGHEALARFLALRPAGETGPPLLAVAVRYFFRREVETNPELFRGLTLERLDALVQAQQAGFDALAGALDTQGQHLEALLADVAVVVQQTHSAVLRIEDEIQKQGQQVQELGQAVLTLLEQHELQGRLVHPGDSLSIRNEEERRLVKQMVTRYRMLPEEQRRQLPGLLNAVGKVAASRRDPAPDLRLHGPAGAGTAVPGHGLLRRPEPARLRAAEGTAGRARVSPAGGIGR
jgi:hypothetical protein